MLYAGNVDTSHKFETMINGVKVERLGDEIFIVSASNSDRGSPVKNGLLFGIYHAALKFFSKIENISRELKTFSEHFPLFLITTSD